MRRKHLIISNRKYIEDGKDQNKEGEGERGTKHK